MTFSQTFQENIHEPWRPEYVAYDDIVYHLKQTLKDHEWNENDESQFETAISLEVEKVDFFINKKHKEIDGRVAYCERTLMQQKTLCSPTASKTLDEISVDLNELSRYARLNVLALQSIADIHDHDTRSNARSLFINLVRSKYLDKQRFDVTLVKISTLQDMVQPTNNRESIDTAKYWVHPNNIRELRAILLFHLPVLASNDDGSSKDTASTCVYFDSPNFDLYQKRLQLDDHNETIRLCWSGSVGSSENVFLERQVRHLSDVTKDTLCLDTKKVRDFIHGAYTTDQYVEHLRAEGVPENIIKTNQATATSVQKSILENSLAPRMRTFYQRTTYQVHNDPRMHISLDTNISCICDDSMSWYTPVKNANLYKFPFAVLGTRLQTRPGEEPPQWLTNLLDSSLVYQVPRFSTYLHGTALLWHRQLPLLPWWLGQLELNIQNANKVSGSLADIVRSKNLAPVINGKRSIGYLNSRLGHLSFVGHDRKLHRASSSGKLNRKRYSSYIYGSSLARTSSVIRPALGSSHSPRWSQDTLSQDDFSPRSGSLPREQQNFYNYSSTDNLIGKNTSDSSYMSNRRKKNNMDQEMNTLFLENITDLEAGGEKFVEEKKKKKKKNPKDVGATVEPKVFFASERTFIRWLHFSATIMMCALTLLNFGDSINRIVGIVFFCICFIFVFYSFGFFRWRSWRIRRKPHLRYDDWFGPPMLCVLLIGALTVNFILRWRSPALNNNYLGVSNNTDTL